MTVLVLLVVPFGCGDGEKSSDPCANVACSSHGECISDGLSAYCSCDPGYEPRGLECAPVPACEENADCNDGVDCTDDNCSPSGTCQNVPSHDRCEGDDLCDAEDGCVPPPECEGDADCADASFCNGAESCVAGFCEAGDAPACEDANACTTDSCDDILGACAATPVDAACDDGLGCNGAEECDVETGCVPGLALDCDDARACTDDACVEGDPPACTHDFNVAAPVDAPAPLWPWNGAYGGSLHAKARGTLRPRFLWRAVAGDVVYHLQADGSCAVGDHSDCDMPSPEIDETGIAALEWTPGADLPVSEVEPVGTRYAWRVRACEVCTGECGPWSAGRYVEVGRVKNDYNGDGYSDVVAGGPEQDVRVGADDMGRIYVFDGGPGGTSTFPNVTLSFCCGGGIPDSMGASVTMADLDADGYADLLAGAPGVGGAVGSVFVYVATGGGGVVWTNPLVNPTGQANAFWGMGLASVGDVDADGYADVVASGSRIDSPEAGEGVAYLFRGAPDAFDTGVVSATTIDPADEVGASLGLGLVGVTRAVAGAGDVNGDGHADVIVGAPGKEGPAGEVDHGRAWVFHGDATGLEALPSATLDNPAGESFFGNGVGGGFDVDGDGFGDVVVGAPEGTFDSGGAAYLWTGSLAGIDGGAAPAASIPNPEAGGGDNFGAAVCGVADVDGDGIGDFVVGAHGTDDAGVDEGAAFFWAGDAGGVGDAEPADARLDSPTDQWSGQFGAMFADAGDVDGDGFSDVVFGMRYAEGGQDDEGLVFVFLGGLGGLEVSPTITIDNPADEISGHFGASVE